MSQQYFTQNARTAFKKALKSFDIQDGDTILLPAYVGINDKEGSGVLDPVEELGVSYEFYAVDRFLAPVEEDIAKKILSPKVKAVLVIHYFGFPAHNLTRIVDLTRTHNKVLIEDCAHALYSFQDNKKLGSFGDAAFFSIHKLLPTKNGGILLFNTESPSAIDFTDDIEENALAVYHNADEERIRTLRRDNYMYMKERLHGAQPFFADLPDGVTPMNFPIWVDGIDRNDFYFKLQEKGIYTSTLYYRLVEGIRDIEFPLSYEISRHISNIPIDQDVSREHLDKTLSAIAEILAR